jgi:hypothetical protein
MSGGGTTYILELGQRASLRVRKPDHNTRGSMLLKVDCDIWDCVLCQVKTRRYYTEPNWAKRYDKIYGFYTDEEKRKAIAENEDVATMAQFRMPSDKSDAVKNADACLLSQEDAGAHTRVEYASWHRVRRELKLFFVEEFPTSDKPKNIAHREYTSILLTFELVVL